VLVGAVVARPAAAYDARIQWSPVAAASGYRLYVRQIGTSWSTGTDIGARQPDPDGVVRYVLSGLPLGVAQDFAVAAYDTGGESALSNVISVLVTATPSRTATATATVPRTATATSALAATRTSTRTPTASSTLTAAATATRTATRSATSTPPASAPPTATRTPPSSSSTPTPTRTATPSPTNVPAGSAIGGTVRYYADGGPVPGVRLALSGSAGAATADTDAGGDFAFPSVAAASWQLRPTKHGDVQQAITSLDASYVLQAISGRRSLDALQSLGCDVTGDGTISTLDASRILQLTVGWIDALPAAVTCGSDWVFSPQPLAVPGQRLVPPSLAGRSCEPGAIAYEPLQTAAPQQDFAAVLIGDCTGNWSAAPPGGALRREVAPPSVWLGAPRRLRAHRWAVPVYVGDRSTLQAFSAHLQVASSSARLAKMAVSGVPSGALAQFADDGADVVALAVALPDLVPIGARPVLVLVLEPAAWSDEAPPDVRLIEAAVDEQAATIVAP
jgi:hypothetical protein